MSAEVSCGCFVVELLSASMYCSHQSESCAISDTPCAQSTLAVFGHNVLTYPWPWPLSCVTLLLVVTSRRESCDVMCCDWKELVCCLCRDVLMCVAAHVYMLFWDECMFCGYSFLLIQCRNDGSVTVVCCCIWSQTLAIVLDDCLCLWEDAKLVLRCRILKI